MKLDFKSGRTKLLPLPLLILADIFAIAAGLILFALFHHVLVRDPVSEPVNVVSSFSDARKPVHASAEEPEPGEDPLVRRFRELFPDGESGSTSAEYRSGTLAVNYSRVEENHVIYHVAEIFVSDIRLLRCAFSGDSYNSAPLPFSEIADSHHAVAALSGDYYRARQEGVVVRNGILYRDTPYEDVCVLWNDGVMECISAEDFDVSALSGRGAWQAWGFGPMLMKDGKARTDFSHALNGKHPRAAIGYAEPGHYFFILVEGRSYYSAGMTFEELSALFASLGCVEAYNLDGGQSANLYWDGKLRNPDLGRPVSDIIYVVQSTGEVGE